MIERIRAGAKFVDDFLTPLFEMIVVGMALITCLHALIFFGVVVYGNQMWWFFLVGGVTYMLKYVARIVLDLTDGVGN